MPHFLRKVLVAPEKIQNVLKIPNFAHIRANLTSFWLFLDVNGTILQNTKNQGVKPENKFCCRKYPLRIIISTLQYTIVSTINVLYDALLL